jgi:ATP-dependent Clp protease, protease subunit
LNTLVNETTEHGETPVDIYTRLANNRILFLYDIIEDKVASDIIATLLLKEAEDPVSKITIFINSEGGDIRNVFAIYDLIQILRCPIETICVGSAMNESVLILAAGSPGMRYATPNAMICASQVIQDRSYYSDLDSAESVLERQQRDNKNLISALAKLCGKKPAEVMKDFDKRMFFTAKQALKYGLIDGVIGSK